MSSYNNASKISRYFNTEDKQSFYKFNVIYIINIIIKSQCLTLLKSIFNTQNSLGN